MYNFVACRFWVEDSQIQQSSPRPSSPALRPAACSLIIILTRDFIATRMHDVIQPTTYSIKRITSVQDSQKVKLKNVWKSSPPVLSMLAEVDLLSHRFSHRGVLSYPTKLTTSSLRMWNWQRMASFTVYLVSSKRSSVETRSNREKITCGAHVCRLWRR